MSGIEFERKVQLRSLVVYSSSDSEEDVHEDLPTVNSEEVRTPSHSENVNDPIGSVTREGNVVLQQKAELPSMDVDSVQRHPVAGDSDTDSENDPDLSLAVLDDSHLPVAKASPPRVRAPTKKALEKIRRHEKKLSDRQPKLVHCGCEGSCFDKIGHDRRKEINSWFWKLDGTEQKSFVLQFSKRMPIKRHRGQKDVVTQNYRRRFSYEYQLEDETGVPQVVCNAFFMNTLGYDSKSKSVFCYV